MGIKKALKTDKTDSRNELRYNNPLY